MLDTIGIFAGTVGVVVLALVAMVYMLRLAWRALTGEVDADTTDLPIHRPSGHVADHDGRDYNSALLALQHEQRRRELIRRVDTAAGVRGPARLEDRRFPSA